MPAAVADAGAALGAKCRERGIETTTRKIPIFEGLERASSAFAGLDTNPISADPTIRVGALDNLKRAVDDANVIGSSIIIGGLYQAHKYFTGTAATSDEWNWSADCKRSPVKRRRAKVFQSWRRWIVAI
jgi:hypothetical protein